MICLVSNQAMLSYYIGQIPDVAIEILNTEKAPTTIIYNNPKHFAKNLIAEDKTIAIRIPDNVFCQELLKQFKGAIVSTSGNISGFATPRNFKEISDDIIKGVDYVVNLHHENTNTNPSKIIKINTDGSLKIIRE
jgi:L-threonylcarbamoyladenylate synthase